MHAPTLSPGRVKKPLKTFDESLNDIMMDLVSRDDVCCFSSPRKIRVLLQCWIHLFLCCNSIFFNPIKQFLYILCPCDSELNIATVVCHFSRDRKLNTPLPMAITLTVFLEIAPTLAWRLWRNPTNSGKSSLLIIKGCPANGITENSPSFLFKKLRWYFVFKLLTVPVMLQM